MSQDQQQLQLDTSGQSQAESGPESTMNDHDRMVPVSEAIKYRRRAQTAEQQVEALASLHYTTWAHLLQPVQGAL